MACEAVVEGERDVKIIGEGKVLRYGGSWLGVF